MFAPAQALQRNSYRYLLDIWFVPGLFSDLGQTTKLLGELTWMATPVPIPNTAVKHPGPMVVAIAARVGYCRGFCEKPGGVKPPGFSLAPRPHFLPELDDFPPLCSNNFARRFSNWVAKPRAANGAPVAQLDRATDF